MAYETIIWEQSGGVGRLTLNRPDSLNAWTPQFGAELRQVLEGDAASDSVRAVLITGAGRGFSSGADLKSGFEPADDGMPNLYKELHEHLPPGDRGDPDDREAGRRRGQRRGGRDRLLAGAGLRPDHGRRVGLLRTRVRQHRPDARRRLDRVRAARGRAGARIPDGDARRADPGAAGARMGPGQLGLSRRSSDGGGRRARSSGWPPARLARTRAPSARSTSSSTATSTPSSSSRPSSSTRSRARRTSSRARPRSSRSARPSSSAGETWPTGRRSRRSRPARERSCSRSRRSPRSARRIARRGSPSWRSRSSAGRCSSSRGWASTPSRRSCSSTSIGSASAAVTPWPRTWTA